MKYPTSRRRDRGRPLPEEERGALQAVAEKKGGMERICNHFGVEPSTVRRRWLKGGNFENYRLADLDEFLRQESPQTATPAVPDNDEDPKERLNELYNRARRAHFELFDPLTAAHYVHRFIGAAGADRIEPEWLLDKLMVTLSMLRQSTYANVPLFLATADCCIHRISNLSAKDKGERLAALVTGIAWELAAFAVQRGRADHGVFVLDEVEATLARLKLNDALPPGRPRIMARMQHWGRNVAAGNPAELYRDPTRAMSRIDDLLQLKAAHPAERFNTNQQKFVELLRMAMSGIPSADDRLMDFYQAEYEPSFIRLTDAISKKGIIGTDRLVTPSTAFSISLHTSVMAHQIDGRRSADILERAAVLHRAVDQTGGGGVMLQRTNPETFKAVRQLYAGKWRSVVPTFKFVDDLSSTESTKLLNHALLILRMVQDCLVRIVTV